ncbi:hypothetical protein Tco_1022858, partial [Tanacetum coccineum]
IESDCSKSRYLKEAIAYRRKKKPETKCTLVDSPATPVEFVTGMLSATTSHSSYPIWVIEKVPNWMRPVTLKKSIQHTIEIGDGDFTEALKCLNKLFYVTILDVRRVSPALRELKESSTCKFPLSNLLEGTHFKKIRARMRLVSGEKNEGEHVQNAIFWEINAFPLPVKHKKKLEMK